MSRGEIDYLVVGHITQDVGDGPPRLGGTALYAALTAQRLGRCVGVLTSLTEAMVPEVERVLPEVALHVVASEHATTFENRYRGDQRQQRLLSQATVLAWPDVPTGWRASPVVHLGPVAQEVDSALLARFAGRFVGVTPQGWMRHWDEAGVVRPAPLPFPVERLGAATALVLSKEDVADEGLALALLNAAPFTVQTDAGGAARLRTATGTQSIAAAPAKVVDPTGAGDVFAAAFFIRLSEGASPPAAVRFAHLAAALAIGQEGYVGIPTRDMLDATVEGTGD